MAFRDFFRGDRDREEEERSRERWREMGGDWRDEDRGGRERDYEYRGSERDYRGRQGYGAERGWSPGSEYYGDRSPSYRGDYDYERQGRGRWGDEREGRGGRDVYSRDYGAGVSGLTGSGLTRGQGGYSADIERGRRGAYGYGGYGRGETGRAESWWGEGERLSGQQYGQHRGKGPRGYRRSDERIREDVCDVLTDDPRVDASSIEVTVKDCEVTLSGATNT
ncbi:MAG TPA: BON domain-containing protein, partial [Steroidobacter sp.]|nr:BON domain-containing protein [Steroidobacter sp.]